MVLHHLPVGRCSRGAICLCLLLASRPVLLAEEPEVVAAGHSYHGEAFNEGPRQAAELMEGIGPIRFPTSATSSEAQRFIEQGLAQLHGFWYLEAERSFRQAAMIEPDLAIAYWGMAMSNKNNAERARGFIREAKERLDRGADRRERLYVDALHRFLRAGEADQAAEGDDGDDELEEETDEEKAKRIRRYFADLEEIIHEFPDDIEAKALLAVQMWMSDRDVPIPSRYAVSALLDEVFTVDPMHPAHHYKIHLWDRQRPENALESAAKCGPSLPAVAHMWHMPGHIYSRLHRYADAAWQQEASARTDHAHMARARLMPDEIHNFAHNNEWLTRNLIHLGRVADALVQARNLVSLPRHPRYNSFEKRGSFRYGHQRLLQVLSEYELWDQLILETRGAFLPETGHRELDQQRTAWLAVAHLLTDEPQRGQRLRRQLQRRRLEQQLRRLDLADREAEAGEAGANGDQEDLAAAREDAESGEEVTAESLQEEIDRLGKLLATVSAAAAARRGDAEAVDKHAEAAKLEKVLHARWLHRAGDTKGAIRIAQEAVEKGPGEVRPLATLVETLWADGQRDEALRRFAELRDVAAHADLNTPMLAALPPIAEAAEAGQDWRHEVELADDLGERPPLDSLGPFQWQPHRAPGWEALASDGQTVSDQRYAGRPRIVIFYLGFGCLHCVEQLHAFSPRAEAFREAGIELVAISTESLEQLRLGLENFDHELEIPLLADPDHDVFKTYRCWDDFEDQPLHGTFLIDSDGRVRWQDISYEPFTEVDFLLEEAKRLLTLSVDDVSGLANLSAPAGPTR